ncbi:hypothetical protein UFOVP67_4 [uncultured Caudovirales phage]|uniref:Calcineurin-like phosphoesterase domain, ApaH type n=1 Tax=uncultured Caudovirales phage TaxID=2100421 RepID=A0A6J5T9G7_9CAUD|nr:hypothetical protein UFOVP67_4 [uncultured Caudovirales phage]
MRTHFLLPDCQVKPNTPLEHLEWAGKYCADKQPDVIVCIGDFADMESLSSYDKGKECFEGRRYTDDIKSAKEAMELFMKPVRAKMLSTKRSKTPWKPRLVLTLGNHENRINRAIGEDPAKLRGVISIDDLPYDEWEVVPFLQHIVIDGVCYSHYFTSGVMGRPVTSAKALISKKHMSCVAGHQQGRDIAFDKDATGRQMTALICGSYYQHDENYMDYQSNKHWRGLYVLHEVDNGSFDELAVSLKYLKRKYGNTSKRVTPSGRKGVNKTVSKVSKSNAAKRVDTREQSVILPKTTKQTTKRGASK